MRDVAARALGYIEAGRLDPAKDALRRYIAAVVGGHVYVLQLVREPYVPGPLVPRRPVHFRILELGADLRDVAQRDFTARPWGVSQLALRADGDHLVADLLPESYEISLDLSRVSSPGASRRFNGEVNGALCGMGALVAMGSVHAQLCWRTATDSMVNLIAWDRDEP